MVPIDAVTVDPGKHTFRFETSGFIAKSEVVLVKEGERGRVVDVVLEPEAGLIGPVERATAVQNPRRVEGVEPIRGRASS